MESITILLSRIDQNQQKIAEYGKFDEAILKKINYKLRLDWNYYSNRMEGGTLTKDETRSIMVGNIDVKGKPLRDVMEMSGHDKLVVEVLKMSKGELKISEKRIKDIHRAIMYEDVNEKQNLIGNWKQEDNEIINYKDEKISFTDWRDVPDAVHKLLDKINTQLDQYQKGKSPLHAVEIAAQFHIDFITIHPFFDGNGRTTRILTNILLMACGFPCIIIKENKKDTYKRILADIQAYGGKVDLFYAFIAERVLETQQLIINALQGKEIEEPGDLDKKIMLLDYELNKVDQNEEVKHFFNKDIYLNIFDLWLGELFEKSILSVQKFNKYFTGINHWARLDNYSSVSFTDQNPLEFVNELKIKLNTNNTFHEYGVSSIIQAHYGAFKKGGLNAFGCNYKIEVKFDNIKYEVFVDEFVKGNEFSSQNKLYEKLLHQPLYREEIDNVVTQFSTAIFNHIDFHTKKLGLR